MTHPLGAGAEAIHLAKRLKNPEHVAVLLRLAEPEVGYYITYDNVAKATGLTHKRAKHIVRWMIRKGLAEYCRGLFDDEGKVCGSGHAASSMGRVVATLLEGDIP